MMMTSQISTNLSLSIYHICMDRNALREWIAKGGIQSTKSESWLWRGREEVERSREEDGEESIK